MSHLTIMKTEGGRPRYGGGTWWHVVHTPTGASVGKYRLRRTAKAVVNEIEARFEDAILSIVDPRILVERMREIDSEFASWIVLAGDFASLAAYREFRAEERRAEDYPDEVRGRWCGQMIHFVEGGRYGRQGTIASVESIDHDGLRCVLAWNETHSVLGTTVHLSDIARGPAPADMPWYRFSSTWRARIAGGVYVIGSIVWSGTERRYGLWTEDPPLGRERLSEALAEFQYRSLEAAQAAAEMHARGETS